MKDFTKAFDVLLNKIKNKENFAFSRFSDGELFIMQNKKLILADNYYVTGFIAPSSDAEIRLRWTTGGGTTQYTTADYNWNSSAYYVDSSHGKAYQENGYHAESYIPICVADIDSDGDSSAGSFSFTIADPNTNILDRPYVHGLSVFRNGGSIKLYGERFVGANEADPNATGFMLYLSSGNLRDYSISVYGCKK